MRYCEKRGELIRVLLVIFAVSIGLVSMADNAAATEKVIDKEFYTSESIVLDDINYQIFLDNAKERIQVHHESKITLIANDTCVRINTARWCLNSTSFDTSTMDYKSRISIYNLAPIIHGELSIQPTAYLGEDVEMKLLINNSGDIQAENITYVQEFPDDIDIVGVSGCSKEGNTVYYSGKLGNDNFKICTIILRTDTVQDRSFGAILKFGSPENPTRVDIDPALFSAIPRVETKILSPITSIYAGDSSNISINFTNANVSLGNIDEVQVSIDFPPTLAADVSKRLSSTIKLGRDGNLFNSSFSITQNWSRYAQFDITGTRIGVGVVKVNARYRILDKWYDAESTEYRIETLVRDLEIVSNFDSEILETSERKLLRVSLLNHNRADIRNLRIEQKSNVFGDEVFYIGDLNGTELRDIKLQWVTGPDEITENPSASTYFAEYYTEYGDYQNVTVTKNLRYKEAQNIILAASASPTRVNEGDEINVRVDVTNPRDVPLESVHVYDQLNEGIKTYGQRDTVISLASGKRSTAYVYKIRAPSVKQATDYAINTTSEYNHSGKYYIVKSQTRFTVVPKRILVSAIKKMDNYNLPIGVQEGITYEIVNNDDEAAYDIKIMAAGVPGLERENRGEYIIRALMPGEKVTIPDLDKIKGVAVGTYLVPRTMVIYSDANGNTFNSTTNEITLAVTRGVSRTGLVSVVKTMEPKILGEHSATFEGKIRVKNKGGQRLQGISVKDNKRSWTILALDPGSEAILTFEEELSPGKHNLGTTTAMYNLGGRTFISESKELVLDVKASAGQTVKVTETEPAGNGLARAENDSETSLGDAEELPIQMIEDNQNKGIFTRFVEFIKKILYWRKEKQD